MEHALQTANNNHVLCTPIPRCVRTGFTLVELLVAILILGLLAATALPRFVHLSDHAYIAKHQATAGAFKAGIMLARAYWVSQGAPTELAKRDDMQVVGTGKMGQLDFNIHGWPSQRYRPVDNDPDFQTENDWDCMTVWQVLMQGASVGRYQHHKDDPNPDYYAKYFPASDGDWGNCGYAMREKPTLTIFYKSKTGEVTVDIDITQ